MSDVKIDIADGWYKLPGSLRVMKDKEGKPRFWWARFAAGVPQEMLGFLLDGDKPTSAHNGKGGMLPIDWVKKLTDVFGSGAKPPKATAASKQPCRHHNRSTDISVRAELRKTAPTTGYAIRMETRVVDEAKEQIRSALQRKMNAWPVCLNGDVHLDTVVDRENRIVSGRWHCTCGG